MAISGQLSPLNGKEIAYIIIDGDCRSPLEIAKEKGMLGASKNLDIQGIIDEIIANNKSTVEKIMSSKKEGPVMFLVGQVMKKIKKQGDPKEIQRLIKEKLGLK